MVTMSCGTHAKKVSNNNIDTLISETEDVLAKLKEYKNGKQDNR